MEDAALRGGFFNQSLGTGRDEMIERMAANHDYLISLEDASVIGGAGSAVLEHLNLAGIQMPLLRLGLADVFPSQGSREQVLQEYDLDADSIRQAISKFIEA